jgi:DNA repair protein RadA/Sms
MKRGESYVCRECGYWTAKWLGRCPACGTYDSFEYLIQEEDRKSEYSPIELIPVSKAVEQTYERIKTGIGEFDTVLGGGIVSGSAVLIAGEPGIGKSTILLQVAASVSKYGKVVYLTGEESLEQVGLRAKRLGLESNNLFLVAEPNINRVLSSLESQDIVLLIADSVQTIYTDQLDSPPGSLVQVREVARLLVRYAKEKNVPVIMIGHITKEGAIAGPKLLEHVVDTVVYFEGDRQNFFRVLRATKNRFGATDEVGVFEMTDKGLMPVGNPSAAFLSNTSSGNSIVFPALEGSRVILTEVQSIVAPTFYPNPRRTSLGIDPVRLSIIVAVLETRASVSFSGCDIYLTTSSGLRIREPGVDLAMALSLYQALTNRSLGVLAAFGELGLDGSVRKVFQAELRLKEIERLGIKKVIMPDYDRINFKPGSGLEIVKVKTLSEALGAVQ